MKTKILSILLLLFVSISNAQINEGFEDITTLTEFLVVNASDAPGITNFEQGLDGSDDGSFPAHEGPLTSYTWANFQATDGVVSDVYLLTPELLIDNGDVISFATRTSAGSGGGPNTFPDRLEVRMGSQPEIFPSTGNVGSYKNLLLSINPDLEVGGYPEAWKVITIQISGLAEPVQSRIAFRYWVTDAGELGSNGNVVGIDTLTIDSELVLSTNDEEAPNTFSKYYNPKRDALRIKAASEAFQNVVLYNTLGQEVLNESLSSSEEVIDLSHISDGNYIVNVYLDNGNFESFKFVKN